MGGDVGPLGQSAVHTEGEVTLPTPLIQPQVWENKLSVRSPPASALFLHFTISQYLVMYQFLLIP